MRCAGKVSVFASRFSVLVQRRELQRTQRYDATAVLAQDPNCEFPGDDVILRLSFSFTSSYEENLVPNQSSSPSPVENFIFVEMQNVDVQ